MIRPVLYVDLPGIIYSIDRRARSRQHEFANFVCWLEPEEKRLPLPPFLRNIFPLNPASRTWICEDHWRILGFAQIQERPSHNMWEVSYLASMVQRNVSSDDVLTALLEYMLEMAAGHGILRIFAKVEDEIPEQELFQRAGFQRYVRELTYVYDPVGAKSFTSDLIPNLPSLRRWNRHHVWGLHQLYRSVTLQRVQMAEMLENSDELAKLLLRFGIRKLQDQGVTTRSSYCQVREYESFVIAALRNSGFEQTTIRALLVRHIALLAMRQRTVPALEQRVVYGVKGLGTVN